MQIIFLQTPEPGVPCELTLLSHLSNNVTLYGLYYPGIGNCVSWCYLTIAPGVIITTHLPTDGGTSIANSWSVAFLDKLKKLGPVAVAGNVRWFEHYHRQKSKGGWNIGASLDEVIITAKGLPSNSGDVTWKRVAWDDREHGTPVSVAEAWQALTGVPVPDFAVTGFESFMLA
jgi:hypothetical protein